MTKELTLTVTDLERKAITFCKEKEITFPIANYLVEFAEEVTKDLQEKNKQLEELLAEQYPDLKQSLDWANEREGENIKRIADLEEKLANADYQLEGRDLEIKELKEQIEKMKNCKNCANYMISGKCPSFFRTGWCKNWEMTKGDKRK